MNCSSCNTALTESHVSGVTVYSCLSCRGVWVPYRSLAHLAKMEPVGQSLNNILGLGMSAPKAARECPSCHAEPLRRVDIKEVAVDLCTACRGIFFDEEEIEKTFPQLCGWKGSGEGNGVLAVSFIGELLSGAIYLVS